MAADRTPQQFLILKTVDGTVHRGWLRGLTHVDGHVHYDLATVDGTRHIRVTPDKTVYAEFLDEGHTRISLPLPEPAPAPQ